MNISHDRKNINGTKRKTTSTAAEKQRTGLVILEEENLWEDLILLAATVKLTLERGNSFNIWQYWNAQFPLFLEADFAAQLPAYWQSRENLWIVFDDSQWIEYQSQIARLPQAQHIILPTEITDFIISFSCENDFLKNSQERVQLSSRITLPRLNHGKHPREGQKQEPIKREIDSVSSSLDSMAILGAHGGAGASLFAFAVAYFMSRSQEVLYIDLDGNCDASSMGVEILPDISPLYRDSTGIARQILASYPQGSLGFYLADGAQTFYSELELHNFVQRLWQVSIIPVFDLGKFSSVSLQDWCLRSCRKIWLVTQGYPRSAVSISRIRKLFPELNFIVVLMGKFRCGLNQILFEQLAQTPINKILPWDVQINLTYHAGKLKFSSGFLECISTILEQ